MPNSFRNALILGIETSCDETAVAVYSGHNGLLAHRLHSQIEIHQEYGGVVPELASRDHIRKLTPLIRETLDSAQITLQDLSAIAYTAGPGLAGALMVGAALATSLAWSLNIPALAIHHLEGHLLAPLLEPEPPAFPFVALLVSGGHTQLIDVTGLGQYRLIGESLDDAAGEAFDKTAKLLGLPYPGGPALANLARHGQPGRFQFPRPMVDRPGLDFSFSGLKTFTLNTFQDHAPALATQPSDLQQLKADIALAFEIAMVETLVIKCRRALQHSQSLRLVVAGGVSANRRLRERMAEAMAPLGAQVFYPRTAFCTDNGAMIAFAGYLRFTGCPKSSPASGFTVRPRWPLQELTA